MPKKLKLTLVTLISLVGLISLVSFTLAQWQEPTLPPPEGQVPAPINVGAVNQYKEGYLAIGDTVSHPDAALYARPKQAVPDGHWAGYFEGNVNITGDLNVGGNIIPGINLQSVLDTGHTATGDYGTEGMSVINTGGYGISGQGSTAGVFGIYNANNYGYVGYDGYGVYGYNKGSGVGVYGRNMEIGHCEGGAGCDEYNNFADCRNAGCIWVIDEGGTGVKGRGANYGVFASGGIGAGCPTEVKACKLDPYSFPVGFSSESSCNAAYNQGLGFFTNGGYCDLSCNGCIVDICPDPTDPPCEESVHICESGTIEKVDNCEYTSSLCAVGYENGTPIFYHYCLDVTDLTSEEKPYSQELEFTAGQGYGVYATGGKYGIYATTSGPHTIDYDTYAGRFEAGQGIGIYAKSTNNIGVRAQGGTYGVHGKGSTAGVYGKDSEDTGYGYVGYGDYGVFGVGTTGVLGYSSIIGVKGTGGNYGVIGEGSAVGVKGKASAGAYVSIGVYGGYDDLFQWRNYQPLGPVRGKVGTVGVADPSYYTWGALGFTPTEDYRTMLGRDRTGVFGQGTDNAWAGFFKGDVKVTGKLEASMSDCIWSGYGDCEKDPGEAYIECPSSHPFVKGIKYEECAPGTTDTKINLRCCR